YWQTAASLRLPLLGEPDAPPAADAFPDSDAAVRDVLALIRARTDDDFSAYKRSTILRRIARRMQVNQVTELPRYLEVLRDRPSEVRALVRDFMISVTQFFRDPGAF